MTSLKNKFLIATFILASCAVFAAQARVKVACMGNSITYGLTLPSPETQSYPSLLANMLGNDYEVRNFGHSGAAVLRKGHHPYTETPEFAAAINYKPDIAVIHLGVNDTDPRSWPNYSEYFTEDYLYIINKLREANPDVRILMARLSPLRATHPRFRSGTRIWRLEAQDLIETLAAVHTFELIDFNEPLVNKQHLLQDGVHPNAKGAELLAAEAYKGITGKYGPLRMAPVYSSGMVLPHSRYLTLSGFSDAYAPITLTLNGHQYRTKASTRGEWEVTVPPLFPGKEYTISVTDGNDSLSITNVLGGMVFLASGQSNMAFTLAEDYDAAKVISSCGDSLLRFYAMLPRYPTNDIQWTEEQVDTVNNLDYFLHTKWQAVNPSHAPAFSAVAYYFARELRDSLQVPVGIIQNAIGGSTTESWVDINTLEEVMPEILLNWRHNDYGHDWAQGRAIRNSGENGRHPYEPSYLFAAGIEPLNHYPVDGVIWYQGESNAHNIEVHADLFRALVKSWRSYFRKGTLPIYFTQLSSLNRPSWPKFRNSLRLLEKEIPFTAMVVTSDWGDSLNVHPRHKYPVGHRLAQLELASNHPFAFDAKAPVPSKAVLSPRGIVISFEHADSLMLSHGTEPLTFEVAGFDRIFSPVKAHITNNKIILDYMDKKTPRYVRYGWQPFTRANLVNSRANPVSTFEIEVSDTDFSVPFPLPETGIEAGLSGCFATTNGSDLVIAGGCNFPGDPFAPGASKKFYQGIYAADSTDMLWHRIGNLPQPTAYGATATTPKGTVLIGGTTEHTPLSSCMLLTLEQGQPVLTPLPSLPAPVDNAYATAIGNTVYLAGGNLNGIPSRSLFALDLDAKKTEWKKLKDMPGNPRVQPVLAAGVNTSGETCLYLFGGFAGRHDKHEPSLELDGLCYTPSTNKWHTVSGPITPQGTPLAVGGGAACTLSSGKIAVFGGVNKDVFLEALRNQAPDYLSHEPEWYRFNPYTLLFDPATESWLEPLDTAAATARAGASIFPGSNNSFFIYGGELKPRVRSSETTHISL